MTDVKEKFSVENFGVNKFMEMIYSAMGIYIDFIWEPTYIWVSYDSLTAEKGSIDADDLKECDNGFIVKITTEYSEDIWDSVVRSFVEFFNNNFDRNFKYKEWYEPEIDEHDEKLFTDDQLLSIYKSCYKFCLENRYEKEPYLIVVDMETYEAIRTTKILEVLDERYECILIESLDCPYLKEVYDHCTYAIEKHFDIIFEMNMIYNFEVYE